MKFVNLADMAKIALMAFVAVWIINHGLEKAGLGRFKA